MGLKKEMYVRVKELDSTSIVKVVEIDQFDNEGFKADNNMYYLCSDILKASFDLIDLIEVGDYVNDKKVTSADPVNKKVTKRYLDLGDYYYIDKSEDIQNIVTKEQFEACKYVVERDK